VLALRVQFVNVALAPVGRVEVVVDALHQFGIRFELGEGVLPWFWDAALVGVEQRSGELVQGRGLEGSGYVRLV
jgi:hypothetical protein